MGVQAKWNGFSWGYDPHRIISVESLSTNGSINVERNQDKEGEPATQTVAEDLKKLSFTYKLNAAAGCNPRAEYERMDGCLGVYAPFYLNGSRYLVKQMMLKSCSASDYLLDPRGRVLSMSVSVEFEEYSEDASGLKRSKSSRGQLRPGVGATASLSSALNVGISSTAKAAFITTNAQMERW